MFFELISPWVIVSTLLAKVLGIGSVQESRYRTNLIIVICDDFAKGFFDRLRIFAFKLFCLWSNSQGKEQASRKKEILNMHLIEFVWLNIRQFAEG